MASARDVPAPANTQTIPQLGHLLAELSELETLVAGWDEQQRGVVEGLKAVIDALNREAFVRLIRAVKRDPAAVDGLRQAASDELVYAVLRHHDVIKASLDERVEQALASVRPYLASHGGDVELVRVDLPDAITIRLTGSCDGCPASGVTLSAGVERAVQEHCPEILHIHKAAGTLNPADSVHSVSFVSPFAHASDVGWIRAASIEEVPESQVMVREVDGASVLLGRFDSKVVCYQNACAHMGMPLDMAQVTDGVLICPHHGFTYSLLTGECLSVPEVQLHTHAVRVRGDDVEVKLT